jgi:hypothetical protein
LPSVVAASAVFVARLTLDPDSNTWVWSSSMTFKALLLHQLLWNGDSFCFVWLQSKKLQAVTGYRPFELKDCITAIHDLQLSRKGQSWNAIRDKYKQHRVSMNPNCHSLPMWSFTWLCCWSNCEIISETVQGCISIATSCLHPCIILPRPQVVPRWHCMKIETQLWYMMTQVQKWLLPVWLG